MITCMHLLRSSAEAAAPRRSPWRRGARRCPLQTCSALSNTDEVEIVNVWWRRGLREGVDMMQTPEDVDNVSL